MPGRAEGPSGEGTSTLPGTTGDWPNRGMVLVIEPKSTIGRLVARPPVWVDETISIGGVARVLRDAGVSSALVGADGAIITERDVARAVAAGIELAGPALPVATRHPVRVASDMAIVDAAALMLN